MLRVFWRTSISEKLPKHAVVVTPMVSMNQYWLYHLLLLLNLNRYATGAAQPGLAVGNLERIHIQIPELFHQESFSSFAHQSDKSKLLSEITQDMASKKIGWRNME